MPVEFLTMSTPHITLFEIALMLLLSALASAFGKPKLTLLIVCSFTLFWGFFINYDILYVSHKYLAHAFIFFGFPFLIILLTLIGMLRRE